MKRWILGSLLLYGCLQTQAQPLSVGEKAPNIVTITSSGHAFTLNQHRGHILVLEWTNHRCPEVRYQLDRYTLQTLQRDYRQRGVHWYRVVSSAVGKSGYVTALENKVIIQSDGILADGTLLDRQGILGHTYGASKTPEIFVIDEHGIIRYQGAIDNHEAQRKHREAPYKPYLKLALDKLLAHQAVNTAQIRPFGCDIPYAE